MLAGICRYDLKRQITLPGIRIDQLINPGKPAFTQPLTQDIMIQLQQFTQILPCGQQRQLAFHFRMVQHSSTPVSDQISLYKGECRSVLPSQDSSNRRFTYEASVSAVNSGSSPGAQEKKGLSSA